MPAVESPYSSPPRPDPHPIGGDGVAQSPPGAVHEIDVAGSHLTVYVESPPLFDAMVRDIAAARTRIWLEVYIFFNDDAGKRIADVLKRKAREGLDVRILYDAIGSVSTPTAFFDDLRQAGAKIHAYHSVWEGLRRFRPLTILNRRDHRKLLVIDQTVGYFGGMNIVDNAETVEQQKSAGKPMSSGWRDVHLRLEGPQQSDLAESFDRSWRRARGERVSRRSRMYRRALLPAQSGEDESIRFFDSGPGRRYSRAARVFSRLMRVARSQITLSMAYFIPVGSVMRALLAARRRKVRIRIIVPGKSDVPLVQRASAHLYEKLLERGFRIYERRQRMLHSKMMIVDDHYTIVGSCNLDPRSLYINLEFLAVIRSHKLAAIMAGICRYETRQSDRITLAHCKRIRWPERMICSMAWLCRWWL